MSIESDTEAITNWDSALPTYLRGLLALFASRGIDADQSDLPEGVRRLLDLAAAVPEAEIKTYSIEFRSRTGGEASYSVEFSHYDVLPGNLQSQIVGQLKAETVENA